MDNYETEEQQVEAIKKWWSENFKMVVVLAVIGLGSIVGVQQWKQNKIIEAQTASVEYDHILQSVKDNKGEPINQQVNTMLTDYPDYPYAALSAMLEAKQLIDADKFSQAEEKYQWVIANAKAQNLQHISRVRLASLMAAQGKNEEALKILDVEQGSFKATYLEIKGDILVALKRTEEARSAYDQALQAYAAIGANAQILKVKRNDLGNS
ncbi:MAG: tetratricopeptide repeat protein [gamma proteobacterium symbiont of Bathyaustriella thionipta]|nr:tetratricopeptide repeat protein [gamma proteobacterium symbiont of Bathyaustriella thionipta]MCU7949069.1 tetratricopeptide repeat protein [gamma proteobacterium symbiont of Bathyaustriella thionipta]MCU7952784.1 tetratricopeptide repeat protein [gamma proteobacterium symbiont of Bathyaustriella thionipta]MCU7955720.1 tetratricopeptide repeat protein [gamma proteobacterium symbiont of Bathyaustriella thionipta]MCU7967808.1 tetratricopeptide repeat protein [gamma proteobacterium symbiont of 